MSIHDVVFRRIDKPVAFTPEERKFFRRLMFNKERNEAWLREEGGQIKVCGPIDKEAEMRARANFEDRHPEYRDL